MWIFIKNNCVLINHNFVLFFIKNNCEHLSSFFTFVIFLKLPSPHQIKVCNFPFWTEWWWLKRKLGRTFPIWEISSYWRAVVKGGVRMWLCHFFFGKCNGMAEYLSNAKVKGESHREYSLKLRCGAGRGWFSFRKKNCNSISRGWCDSISWGDTIVFLGGGGSLTRNMRRKIVVSKRLRVESVVDRHSFLAHHWILILDNSSSLYSTLELTLLETLVKVHIFNTTSLSFCPDRENPALRWICDLSSGAAYESHFEALHSSQHKATWGHSEGSHESEKVFAKLFSIYGFSAQLLNVKSFSINLYTLQPTQCTFGSVTSNCLTLVFQPNIIFCLLWCSQTNHFVSPLRACLIIKWTYIGFGPSCLVFNYFKLKPGQVMSKWVTVNNFPILASLTFSPPAQLLFLSLFVRLSSLCNFLW